VAEQNGAGADVSADDAVAGAADPSSLNGYGAAPEPPMADRPEVLLGVAVLGGVLLAGMVSRFGR
jgi:hypothetical protein